MEIFCDSTFWDEDLTWNQGVLEFTPCFQETVLAWGPCIFLWIFMWFDIHYLKVSQYRDIPWNYFNISKIVINILLICLSVIDILLILIGRHVPYGFVVSPAVRIVTLVSIGMTKFSY